MHLRYTPEAQIFMTFSILKVFAKYYFTWVKFVSQNRQKILVGNEHFKKLQARVSVSLIKNWKSKFSTFLIPKIIFSLICQKKNLHF